MATGSSGGGAPGIGCVGSATVRAAPAGSEDGAAARRFR
jgi:hypothetical protein